MPDTGENKRMAKKNDIVKVKPVLELGKEYRAWRERLVKDIHRERYAARLRVNAELLTHYYHIGCEILRKQEEQGWGAQVISILAKDLEMEFGKRSGYSEYNLRYMKRFAEAYPHFPYANVSSELTPKQSLISSKLAGDNGVEIAQISTELTPRDSVLFPPMLVMTWSHHIELMTKVKDPAVRAFYINKTVHEGWSMDVMALQIDSKAHLREINTTNNFALALPAEESDLAKALVKDHYQFGFVDMANVKKETDLEDELVLHVSQFLTEMGKGFAYVGHQYPVNVDIEDDRIDLLMYNMIRHCYVVIELKVGKFDPEHISKLNYYVSAIDLDVKSAEDRDTIGIILCREKSDKKVMYAMRGVKTPIGVATYSTEIISEIEQALPSWGAWDEAHPLAIDERKFSKRATRFMDIVKVHPDYTREKIAELMKVSKSTIARLLREELKGVVSHEDGHWVINL